MADTSKRMIVVSSDTHCGADLYDYRPYLVSQYHDEFDEWSKDFRNPFESEHLLTNDPSVNWDSSTRTRLLESQGIVGEVMFPNTVPPFYPQTQFFVPPPPENEAEYRRRWAGLKAHNRWLVEFCSELPGRRAGVAQIMLNDIDDAVAEIHWVKAHGLTGGVLLPGVPPGSRLPPLYSHRYEPIWEACEELDVTVNSHSGGGIPHYSDDPVALAVLLKEVTWFSNRNLAHLIWGGVFERHPHLRVAFTEQGSAWVVPELATLDSTFMMMRKSKSAQHFFGGDSLLGSLTLMPSEYFARNCYLGSSPLRLSEAQQREVIGVDRIMWGNDFPHIEGTFPYSVEAIRYALCDAAESELDAMLSDNACHVYGFDRHALRVAAEQHGPTLDQLLTPLSQVPLDSLSSVFIPEVVKAMREAT